MISVWERCAMNNWQSPLNFLCTFPPSEWLCALFFEGDVEFGDCTASKPEVPERLACASRELREVFPKSIFLSATSSALAEPPVLILGCFSLSEQNFPEALIRISAFVILLNFRWKLARVEMHLKLKIFHGWTGELFVGQTWVIHYCPFRTLFNLECH